MHLHRYTAGILFNRHYFDSIDSSGKIIDAILNEYETNEDLENYSLSNVNTDRVNNRIFLLIGQINKTQLIYKTNQFIFKKTCPDNESTLSANKAHKEFEFICNSILSVYKLPPIRRIGLVAEYRISANENSSASDQLVEAFLKTDTPEHAGKFHLTYEDRKLTSDGKIPNIQTDEFSNTIYTFYSSDRDETPIDGMMNANIDVQEYYNPAKTKLLPELKKIRTKFGTEKTKFKQKIDDLGLE